MQVQFVQPDKMNLVGYFLRDILNTNLISDRSKQLAANLQASVLFNVNGMLVTVVFAEEAVEMHPGRVLPIHATIVGELPALLEVALGANFLKYVLRGSIKFSGNILKLLKLVKLLQRSQ